MRLAAILVFILMIGTAAFQSVVGGAPEGEADEAPVVISTSDICTVEVATLPELETLTREITIVPAYRKLDVIPARFGTRTETVEIVPAHREGASFVIETRRIIVSEPTRRLRALDPVFDSDLDLVDRTVLRPRVEGGRLVEETTSLEPVPASAIVLREARVEAVRINAGLKMVEIKVLDRDGEGEHVPAETVDIEVRTVEVHPRVETRDIPAVTETVEVETVKVPSIRIEAEAICTIASRDTLIRLLRQVLEGKGFGTGASGPWSPALIDAMAAAQAEDTGLVSPYLLLNTLRTWLSEVGTPIS